MAEGARLGFIIFYVVYIGIIVLLMPAQFYEGSGSTVVAPDAPTDIVTFIFAAAGQAYNVVSGLFVFSISIWWLGFLNAAMTIGAIWTFLEFARGNG